MGGFRGLTGRFGQETNQLRLPGTEPQFLAFFGPQLGHYTKHAGLLTTHSEGHTRDGFGLIRGVIQAIS